MGHWGTLGGKKMFRRASRCICLVGIILLTSSAASASLINHGDFLGANVGDADFLQVTEDTGAEPGALFGAPIHVNNKLLFLPTAFAATASNGNSDSTTGILTMTIVADAGYYLDSISLGEVGDYTLLGLGTPATYLDVTGDLTVTDLSPGTHGGTTGAMTVSPMPPFFLPTDSFGEFTGSAMVNLSGLQITEVTLEFVNTLGADSEIGTTSFIQKKTIDIEVTSVPVPEPASAALVGIGLLVLTRRKRLR